MEFLQLSNSCTPVPTELKQLLSCEPPNVGSNMCSGGMFEDGLGVQERRFLQLQVGGGSIHAFFFSPILAHVAHLVKRSPMVVSIITKYMSN